MANSCVSAGNELGMGKVAARAAAAITHGELITCRTATDFTVTAGVSNWGGHALCGALVSVADGKPPGVRHRHGCVLGYVLTVDRALVRRAPRKRQLRTLGALERVRGRALAWPVTAQIDVAERR